jgi:hypothetical protein
VEARGLAEEEAREVEEVEAHVHDREALDLGEIGLRAVGVEAVAEAEVGEERLADRTLLREALRLPERPLPAEVFVHHERHARLAARRHHGAPVCKRLGERLLADGRDLGARREFHQRPVRLHRRGDVHEVERLAGEHVRRIVVDGRHAKGGSGGLRFLAHPVADGGDLHTLDVGPGVKLVLREEAAADHAQAQGAIRFRHDVPLLRSKRFSLPLSARAARCRLSLRMRPQRKEGLGFSVVIPDAVQHKMLHC